MSREELLDLVDEAYQNAKPVAFADKETALRVVGAGLKFLTDLIEEEDDCGDDCDKHVTCRKGEAQPTGDTDDHNESS